MFLIDVEGHQQEESVKKALAQIAKKAIKINILGSYPVTAL
jgi:chorismate mutase/prephenate dehydratase